MSKVWEHNGLTFISIISLVCTRYYVPRLVYFSFYVRTIHTCTHKSHTYLYINKHTYMKYIHTYIFFIWDMCRRGETHINRDLIARFVLPDAGSNSQSLSLWQQREQLGGQRLNATCRWGQDKNPVSMVHTMATLPNQLIDTIWQERSLWILTGLWFKWFYSMMTSSNGNISTLLAICAGHSPVPGEFPTQRPVTWSFDFFLWSAPE